MGLREGAARAGGRGAFTTEAVRAGARIATWASPLVRSGTLDAAAAPRSLLAYDDWVMPPAGDANDLVDHACEPSAGVRFALLDRAGRFAVADLVALRDLAAGEEVTFDYTAVLGDARFAFACRCGAPGCRGAVETWDRAPREVRERLLAEGFASPAVLRRFAADDLRPLEASPDAPPLAGRRLLVTGGSGGIGAALVRALARGGARSVAFTYLSRRESALALAREVEALGARALALQADAADAAALREAAADAIAAAAGLDGLACVAGAPFDAAQWDRPLEAVDLDFCARVFRVDALGSLAAIQASARALGASGSGRVVLFGSTPPLTGDTVGHPYLLAKAAVLALGRAAAQALGPRGVHVNALALGHVETEAMKTLAPAEAETLRREVALGRGGRPQEIAAKAVFLLGRDCEFMTGTTLVVDGGYPRLEG